LFYIFKHIPNYLKPFPAERSLTVQLSAIENLCSWTQIWHTPET